MPEPILERGRVPSHKPEPAEPDVAVKAKPENPLAESENPLAKSENPLADLQRRVGNRAVGRLIRRSGAGPAEVDEETAGRIDASRGGGQDLDRGVTKTMGAAMGSDFSEVRVHTSPESDELNKRLGAQAFTTGSDIFFSDGAYDPHSASGRELLAHELAHVVQQGSGRVGAGGGAMTVNEPGDAHEQEADAVAGRIAAAPVQLQEEEEMLPAGALDEEEMPGVQRQGDVPEEEEEQVQRQTDELEEEELLEE